MPARVSRFALTAALVGLAAALPNYGYPQTTTTSAYAYPVGTGVPYPSSQVPGYVHPTDYYDPPITYTDYATKTQTLTLTSSVPCDPYTSNGAVYSSTASEYVSTAVLYSTAVYTKGCDEDGNCYGQPQPTSGPVYHQDNSNDDYAYHHRYPYDVDQGMCSYGYNKSGSKYYVDADGKAYCVDKSGKKTYVTMSDKPYYVDDEAHKSYYMDGKLGKAYYVDSDGKSTYITKDLYTEDSQLYKFNADQGMTNYGYDKAGNSYYVDDSGKPYTVDKAGKTSYITGHDSTTPYYTDDNANKKYYVDSKVGTAYCVDKSGKKTYITKAVYTQDTPSNSVQMPVDHCEVETVYVTVTKTVGTSSSTATDSPTTYADKGVPAYGDAHGQDSPTGTSVDLSTDNDTTGEVEKPGMVYGGEDDSAHGHDHSDSHDNDTSYSDDQTKDHDHHHRHHNGDYSTSSSYPVDYPTSTDSPVEPCSTSSTSVYVAVPTSTCVPAYGVTCPDYPTYMSSSSVGYPSAPVYPTAASYDPGYVAPVPEYATSSATTPCTTGGSYATSTPNSYA